MSGSSVISRLKSSELRIDRICRRFEQAWRQQRPISIEECLLEVEILEQPRLLEELVASEWELRIRRAETPSVNDYLNRFSEHTELIETVCSVMKEEFTDRPPVPLKSTPQEGDQLGDYRIIREIGRGGMGIVFEARQESLGRQVALKVLPARRFQNERELLRFRREAQSVARLHHSHIVEIYGVGEQDGVHYFAMRYVVGRGLDEVISELRLRLGLTDAQISDSVLHEPLTAYSSASKIHTGSSLFLSRFLSNPQDSIDSQNSLARYRAVARIGHQVAEALQYAHERGVLHRDVKPSNLILDRHELCWLSDFGLAKVHLDAVDLTESDDLVGTMKYMSPEALTGKMDERSDLYSLGLTLYELATLRPALDATDRGQLIEQVKDPQPPAPRRFAPEIPRDLETVILKAMSVDPSHRYSTAKELADDLERFLNREPIKARPQSTLTKLRRWIERKPLMAFLALGTMSITATSMFSFMSLYFSARQTAFNARLERDRANQLREEAVLAKNATEISQKTAERLTVEVQNRLIHMQRSKAATSIQRGDDFGSLTWTAETLRLFKNASQFSETHGLEMDSDARDIAPVAGSTESAVEEAPFQGLRLLQTEDSSVPGLDQSGHLRLEPALRLRVGAIAQFAPQVLRRVWLPKVINQWMVTVNGPVDTKHHSWDDDRILFDKSGNSVILTNATQTRQARWDLATGVLECSQHNQLSESSAYTNAGEARVCWTTNQTLQYEEIAGSRPQRQLESPPQSGVIRPVGAWQSADGKYLLASFRVASEIYRKDEDVVAWLWNLESGQLANSQALPMNCDVLQVEFSRDCRRMFVRSDSRAQVYELPHWRPLLPDEPIDPNTASWSHDGQWFATKSDSNTALYQIGKSPTPAPQLIESPGLHGIRFEEGGGGMALLLQRGQIAFLGIGDGEPAQFRDFSNSQEIDIRGFTYSPDGQWYALAYNDGNVRIWSVHYNQPMTGLMRHSAAVTSVAWSPGGDLLATLTQDGLLTIWDVRNCCSTGQIFFHPSPGRLNTVRLSPDGSRVAAGGLPNRPAIWNLRTGQLNCLPVNDGPDLINSQCDRLSSEVLPRSTKSSEVETRAEGQDVKQTNVKNSKEQQLARRSPFAIAGFPEPELQQLAWSEDGHWLAGIRGNPRRSDGSDNENYLLHVWETHAGMRLPFKPWPYRVHPRAISMPQFTNDGRILTHSTSHADLIGWAGGPSPVRFQSESTGWLAHSQYSPDQQLVAIAQPSGHVSLFRSSNGTLLHKLSLPKRQTINGLMFNPQGTQLAAVGKFGLRVWDTNSGRLLQNPEEGALLRIQRASYSIDGRHLAIVTENHACHFFDTVTWQQIAPAIQLESRPILAKFHPVNQAFITATDTGVVQMWDWSHGEQLTPPLRNVQSIHDADLSSDGSQLAVVCDHAIRIWKLPLPDQRSVREIAQWARDVTLTTVDDDESSTASLPPREYPDGEIDTTLSPDLPSPLKIAARISWHERQANEAHLNRDAVAEEFHILRLEAIAPKYEHLKELRQRLAALNSSAR